MDVYMFSRRNISLPAFVALLMTMQGGRQCQPAATAITGAATENPVQDHGPMTEGFVVAASPDKQKYTAGEAVLLTVAIKNTTSRDLSLPILGETEPLQQFEFDVRTGDGQPVPLTAFGKVIPKYLGFPAIVVGPTGSLVVYSHEEADFKFYISRIYDMSRSGVYLITVRRPRVPKLKGRGEVILISNTVRVEVEEPTESFYNSRYYPG